MLRERGVDGVDAILAGLDEKGLEGAEGAIAWWDELPHSGPRAVGTGLLVKSLREGGKPSYRRVHFRRTPDGEAVLSKGKQRMIRATALVLEGCSREEAIEVVQPIADEIGSNAIQLLIDLIGPEWRGTPPHPAYMDLPDGRRPLRYAALCGEEVRPNVRVMRQQNESLFDFACRFWGWRDPEWPKEADKPEDIPEAEIAPTLVAAGDSAPPTEDTSEDAW